MNIEKQKLLLSYLTSSYDLFAKCNAILRPEYFEPEVKKCVTFIKEYFNQHKHVPGVDQVQAETGVTLQQKNVGTAEMSYATTEIENFCKNKAIEYAILSSPPLIEKGEFGQIEKSIRDALMVGINRELGLDYFQDPLTRLKQLTTVNSMYSTGWDDLDYMLGGGVNKQELNVFAGPPGKGKSMVMLNVGKNLLTQFNKETGHLLNGVYFSMELAENLVAKRLDSMLSGFQQQDILPNLEKVSDTILEQRSKYGRLTIKRMPESTTNCNHLRAFLKEYELVNGSYPDFIITDYLDIMASNNPVSAENLFVKDKFVSEELRALAFETNSIGITASQLGRSAIESEKYSQAQIAGGMSKVNTADNLIGIRQDEAHKAQGIYILELLKTRSSAGVGNHVTLAWDPQTLVIGNRERKEQNFTDFKSQINQIKTTKPRSIDELLKLGE
ncbi:hypothetical protein RsoM2USA_441 [Ralstonia phage RsoM2USA]|nr:hypothetical protein RsoM2USA_441 [Ralstonia phage RsoM2USA]